LCVFLVDSTVKWLPQAITVCRLRLIAERGFDPWSVYGLSVVDAVALGQLSLQVRQFLPDSTILQMLYTPI